jgi:hypothetical protein
MKATFQIETDIRIPDHLYNEAVELFLNHLEKGLEAQLLKYGNSFLTSQEQEQMKNSRRVAVRPLSRAGQSLPLYYKKGKNAHSASPRHQNQI